MSTFYKVTEQVLSKYVKDNNLKSTNGEWFHEIHYINEAGEVKAKYASSSYSSWVDCSIADPIYANFETVNIVGSIFDRK